jgi:LmbE family N-acetylglucosaminyl deacetylase
VSRSGIGVLSPHLDDAALSCYSVLSRDEQVTVINVFAGLPDPDLQPQWFDRLTGADSPRARSLERLEEDAAVLERLNCARVNLPFLEDQYRRRVQDVKPVAAALLEALGDTRTVYAPAAIGGHPDHVATKAAALHLLRRGVSVTLYAELPYAHDFGWPDWLTGEDPDPFVDPALHWEAPLTAAGASARDAVVEELAPEARRRKLELIRGYRTQFPVLDRRSGRAFSRGDALAYELFWPLEPPALEPWRARKQELLWQLGLRHGGLLKRVGQRPLVRKLRLRMGAARAPGR